MSTVTILLRGNAVSCHKKIKVFSNIFSCINILEEISNFLIFPFFSKKELKKELSFILTSNEEITPVICNSDVLDRVVKAGTKKN